MSREVTIKRKLPFYHEQQEDLRDWFADASAAIGSYFEKGTSSKIGSGMTIQEEGILMPYVLSIPREDPEFRRAVAKYFSDINTIVPEQGIKLEVGLKDESLPVSDTNLPINVEDYITFRHACGHPWTGKDLDEAKGNPLKKFYVEDQHEIKTAERASVEEKDIAMQDYYDIKGDAKKVRQVLTLLGKSVSEKQDAVVLLRTLAEEKPTTFHKVATDKDLQLKFEIKELVSTGVLDLVRGKYIRVDTAETLGNEFQTVAWFKSKENSKDVAMLKAMKQEKVI